MNVTLNRVTLLPVGQLIGYLAGFVSDLKPVIDTNMAM